LFGATRDIPPFEIDLINLKPLLTKVIPMHAPTPRDDVYGTTIRAAQVAWNRLKQSTRHTWDEWKTLGCALELGQQRIFAELKITRPYGRGYQREIRAWLDTNGFADIEATTRSRLLSCMADIREIDAWRETLPETIRNQLNNPLTVWKHWGERVKFAEEMENVDVEEIDADETSKYIVTPPDVYEALDDEFHFDFDPCPLNPDFDGLKVPWGKSNYVNPPFVRRGEPASITDFARKAIAESKLGNLSVLVVPAHSHYMNMLLEAGAEQPRSMGRVRWLHTETGEPMSSPPAVTCFILRGKDAAESVSIAQAQSSDQGSGRPEAPAGLTADARAPRSADVVEARADALDMGRYYARHGTPDPGKQFYDAYNRRSDAEWYTPAAIFDALECRFDLDPASPGQHIVPWIPVDKHYSSGGLVREWQGFIWLNPPYGRDILPGWIQKFIAHGNGIAIVAERSSTVWWQDLVAHSDLVLFINKKLSFVRSDVEIDGCFPIGHCLVAIGEQGVAALRTASRNGLGLLMKLERSI
jgi:hypothetical protein